MPVQRHTRESIVQILKNVATQLKKQTLSKREVQPHLPLSAINYHFGNLGNALKAAGLVANKPGPPAGFPLNRLTEEDVFASILEVEKKIGHDPSLSEYRANGGTLSGRPFRNRFGTWEATLQYYRKWKADCGDKLITSNNDALGENGCSHVATVSPQPSTMVTTRVRKAPQLFGEPIDFRGLRHVPINEQGVVYLFGMVSRELGFSIEALQQGFPDCEGKYLHDKSRQLWVDLPTFRARSD